MRSGWLWRRGRSSGSPLGTGCLGLFPSRGWFRFPSRGWFGRRLRFPSCSRWRRVGLLASGRFGVVAAVGKAPSHLEYSITSGSEKLEQTLRQVQRTVTTGRALVHNCCVVTFAFTTNIDTFKTIGARISTSILCRVQSNNEIARVIILPTRSHPSLIVGCSSRETLLEIRTVNVVMRPGMQTMTMVGSNCSDQRCCNSKCAKE